MGRLKDKVAVITGAASGFGEGMAKRFAEEGARIVVADLNVKGAERVAGEIGKAAIWVQTDVSQKSEFDEMVRATHRRLRPHRHHGQQCRLHASQRRHAGR